MDKKVRIEIRYDEEKDKDMIDFIDEYGSTRAGFIKQVLRLYKHKIEGSGANSKTPEHVVEETISTQDKRKNKKSKRKKKKKGKNG